MKNQPKDKLIELILNAVALGMGISSFVLLILSESNQVLIPLIIIAIICLSIVGIKNVSKQ